MRGKSFECMSLLGIAVGKEKFLNDAKEAISAMMNTQVEADDVQRERPGVHRNVKSKWLKLRHAARAIIEYIYTCSTRAFIQYYTIYST